LRWVRASRRDCWEGVRSMKLTRWIAAGGWKFWLWRWAARAWLSSARERYWRVLQRSRKAAAQSAKRRWSRLAAVELGEGVVGGGEREGGAGEVSEGVERAEGGGFGIGGDDFAPELVLLGLVEQEAGFVAGEDEVGEEGGGPLGEGEDGRRVPGSEAEGALVAVVGEAEGTGGVEVGDEDELAVAQNLQEGVEADCGGSVGDHG
jgi:hypothetical protein